MTAVLLTRDLMIASRVEGAAARVGVSLRTSADSQDALAHCAEHPVRLLIVDLSAPALDMAGLVRELKVGPADAPFVVAFGPHVHEALLAAAREAGCDEVISRGQFFAQIDEILRRA